MTYVSEEKAQTRPTFQKLLVFYEKCYKCCATVTAMQLNYVYFSSLAQKIKKKEVETKKSIEAGPYFVRGTDQRSTSRIKKPEFIAYFTPLIELLRGNPFFHQKISFGWLDILSQSYRIHI